MKWSAKTRKKIANVLYLIFMHFINVPSRIHMVLSATRSCIATTFWLSFITKGEVFTPPGASTVLNLAASLITVICKQCGRHIIAVYEESCTGESRIITNGISRNEMERRQLLTVVYT
jgi:hypothetical protein